MRDAASLYPHQHLVLALIFILTLYNRYTVISHWVLICVFLMTSDVEHFFLLLFAISIFPSVKFLISLPIF